MHPQLPQSWIEPVAEPVAEEVEAHDDEEDGDAGQCGYPPGAGEVLTAVGGHDAPCGGVRRHSYAEEAERRFSKNEGAHAQAANYKDGADDAGENVSEEDTGLRCALDAGVAHVVGLSEGEGFSAYNAGEVVPSEEYEQDDDEFEALPEDDDDNEGDE